MQLQAYLLKEGWEVGCLASYTNNIYLTRHIMWKTVVESNFPDDTLMLWVDDDNPLSVQAFVKLLDDLEAHPEADLVSGWYWLATDVADGGRISAGKFGETGTYKTVSVTAAEIEHRKSLVPVEWVAFGCVLMRMSAIEKAGHNPFTPVPCDSEFGVTGDDISFCARLHEAGGVQLMDPQVQVPHLKLRCVAPPVARQEAAAA
jgi:GT2 family glycosyltransferase